MPLLYRHDITSNTRLAIWKIEEAEHFFQLQIPLISSVTHPHKRLQHLAGRYLLPLLFPDFPTEKIKIASTRKPFLPNEQYHFSISHCSQYAAAIVSNDLRVGIDVELLTNRLHIIKHKFLHDEELQFVNALPQKDQLIHLCVLWSAKEAMYKWYGEGEVDFSEMLRIGAFDLNASGQLQGRFANSRFQQNLDLNYFVIKELTLVWVAT